MKHKIRIEKSDDGVTIWVNNRWIMDASLFKEEMELSINKSRMKRVKNYEFKNHRRFRYDKRFK